MVEVNIFEAWMIGVVEGDGLKGIACSSAATRLSPIVAMNDGVHLACSV